MEAPRILMADDEAPIRLTMEAILRRRGYDVTVVEDGTAALALAHQRPWDLLLLDLKMPGMSGIDVAHRARERQPDVAIIILTGHGSLDSAIEGIHAGVFDYMLKTSSPQEVVARVAAALGQQQAERSKTRVMNVLQSVVGELGGAQPPQQPAASNQGYIMVGDLEISTWNQTVRHSGETLTLTPTEFRILTCLAQQAGTPLSFSQLVQCAQGYEAGAAEAAELVKPHIYHLRQKLEVDPSNPRYLLTVRGTGYLLAKLSTDEAQA